MRVRSDSLVTRVLRWITGLAALTATYTGLTGARYQEEARIEASGVDLSVVFSAEPDFFLTYRFLSRGVCAALGRLAQKEPFHSFAYWPDAWSYAGVRIEPV